MKFFGESTNWLVGIKLKIVLISVLLLLASCDLPRIPLFEISGNTMGTTYRIKGIREGFDVDGVGARIADRLRDINQVFSTYIPDSEISLLNKNLSADPIPVSAEMMELLLLCRSLYELTDGAFDVTVGPLVNLWGFGPDGPGNGVPDADVLDQARTLTGFDQIVFGENTITRPPGLIIDLSAVAKGYGVDEIAAILDAEAVKRYMVEIGGEVKAVGTNQRNKTWQIGVELPDRMSRKVHKALPLRDLGMATSGDYRNYFVYEGENYSHTIDPDTGWPVTHNMASVTVLHPSAAYADGIATGFSVLGLEQTMVIANQQALAVLAIIRESDGYREVRSETLDEYLEAQR